MQVGLDKQTSTIAKLVFSSGGTIRVSLGPSFLKIAIKSMKTLAIELKSLEGLSAITENEITSDYLKALINN